MPLIWWPWWAFNPSDFYLSSVLEMERLQREGIIDRGVQFVPVLDGLERMPFHDWFLSPFSNHKVNEGHSASSNETCMIVRSVLGTSMSGK